MNTNQYYNPYNPYITQPITNPFAFQNQPAQMEIQKVNGEESAKAFPIGPNSSVILLDINDPLIWIVITDASGYKTVTPYSITPFVKEKPVSASDLEEQMSQINSRLEKIEERMNSYGQSGNGAAWKNKSGYAGNQSNGRNGQGGQGSNGGDSAAVNE